jgi:hypothetical protein
VQADDAYAKHLRRTKHPDRCPVDWVNANALDND